MRVRSMSSFESHRMPSNKQLERTVIRRHVRAASAAVPLCGRGAHDSSARGRSTAR